MSDDILLNKAATIERCMKRIEEEYHGQTTAFRTNFTKQDAIILNIERMIQAALDMAAHIIKTKKMGLPQSARETFTLLQSAQMIDEKLCHSLQKMVGFRNIAIHDYQNLNLDVVEAIIEVHLKDIILFKTLILTQNNA